MDYQRRPDSAFPGPRRVFTAPTYAGSAPETTSSTNNGGSVETLYNHPSVKIVAFTAGPRPVFSYGKDVAPPPEIAPGSLPWSSQLERTIAAGQFRIYRAPGSVAFLSCGSALQPILPKSQCWCVDELSSKYVLQIRRPQYWRIEVPVTNQDETRRALELRDVLGQILQFEKTECPFTRAFTVELPERPQTPVKRRPWTPVSRRTSMVLPPTPGTPVDIMPIHGERGEVPASVVTKSTAYSLGESMPLPDVEVEDTSADAQEAPERRQEGDPAVAGTVEGAVSALEVTVRAREDAYIADDNSRLAKPSGFQSKRSVTAPPQLTLVTAQPLNLVAAEPLTRETTEPEAVLERSGSRSPTDSSEGSFHSVDSWTTGAAPLPPSPPLTASGSPKVLPYPQQHLYVPKKAHQLDTGELTITPNTPSTLRGDSSDSANSHKGQATPQDTSTEDDEASSTCSALTAEESLQSVSSTEALELPPAPAPSNLPLPPTASATIARTTSTSSSSSTILARRPYMRHRPTTSSSISPSRGALPRLPSAAELFPTYRANQPNPAAAASRLSLVRRLPTAIMHKTLEILFSPPSHLIDLMLRVAARIAAGEWRGYVFGFGDGGERIPVRWDWSDGDDDGEGELGGWGADEDWEFTRMGGKRRSPTNMVGAFPESPDEDAEGGDGGMESPSLERRRRGGRGRGVGTEGDEEEDGGEAANADWTGSLSID